MLLDLMAVPLGALLDVCHSVLHSYALAIVLFTALTKVILFPVSLWTQRNSIKMVELTPKLNTLKIKYYGDKDAIAEETQKLYKQKHYHPLASTIPMFIQLALLIGVIGAVRRLLEGTDSVLSVMPFQAGGATLLVPLAAGLAALVLGLAQNRLNPLQREQSPVSQWATNGFSIAISLALGAFVPVGVGIYWIASNLLTIVQQIILNAVMPPKKYVDYEALAKSKQELAEIEGLSVGVSKEDKQRENADYKRFFSVANKHLVFYSESSGFYKYFRGIIAELLQRTNITIHYITSDPKDQIFRLAEAQPRIRPYYIGEKRLITLMMKMDADMVVMTLSDLGNYHIKRSYVRKDVEYVYMFHYPLSTHMVLHTGALDHYDTVLCVGKFQFDEIRFCEKLHGTPEKRLVECGYGLLEDLRVQYEQMPKSEREHKKILIAPSWQTDNILDTCIDRLLEQLLGKGYQVVVRPHPEYMKRYRPRMDAIVERYAGYQGGDLSFELDFTSSDSIFDSDLVITDWSGTAYEFAFVTLKPTIFINTPPKIHNSEYDRYPMKPLELTLRSQVGVELGMDGLDGLADAAAELLEHKEAYQEKIAGILSGTIANFGKSAKIGSDYIVSRLKERQRHGS